MFKLLFTFIFTKDALLYLIVNIYMCYQNLESNRTDHMVVVANSHSTDLWIKSKSQQGFFATNRSSPNFASNIEHIEAN